MTRRNIGPPFYGEEDEEQPSSFQTLGWRLFWWAFLISCLVGSYAAHSGGSDG